MGGHPPYPQRRPPAVPPGRRGTVRLRQLAMPPKKDKTCLYVSLGIAALFFFLIFAAVIGIVVWKSSSNNKTVDDYERRLRAAQAAKSEPAVQTKVVEKIIEREVPVRSAPPPRQRAPPPAPRNRSGFGRSFKKACAWGAGFSIGSSVAGWFFRRRLPEKSE